MAALLFAACAPVEAAPVIRGEMLEPDSPEYEWVDPGEVLRSRPGDPWNAIDPNLVLDEDGESWLAWGSFWDADGWPSLPSQTQASSK